MKCINKTNSVMNCLFLSSLVFLLTIPSAFASRSGSDRFESVNQTNITQDYIQNVVLPAKQSGKMTDDMWKSLGKFQLQQQMVSRFVPGRDRLGGPDEGGYVWIDSEEENGPAFDWIDISQIGQRLDATDDWNSDALDLGWNFNFYDQDYNSIYVCSNGWASFLSNQTWFAMENYPNGIEAYGAFLAIQPLDMNPNEGGELRFYTDANEQLAVISWNDIPQFNQGGNNRSSFQIVLRGDGTIKFQYADDNAPTGENCVVGIQNEMANIGLTVSNQEQNRLVGGYTVMFELEPAGPPPAIFVSPFELHAVLNTGESTSEAIIIENRGEGDLEFETNIEEIDNEGRDNIVRRLRGVRQDLNAGPVRDEIDLSEYRFASFQDQESYGYIGDLAFAQIENLNFDIYRNCDLAGANLEQYDAIIIAGANQSQNFYNQYQNNLALLEDWLASGGALYYENGPDDQPNILPPGDVAWEYQWEQNGTVIVSPDPQADNYSRLAELMGWNQGDQIHGNAMFHCHYNEASFQNINQSDWYQIISVGSDSQQPGLVAYGWGNGVVVLCGAPVGFVWRNYANAPDWGSAGAELLTYMVENVGLSWLSVEPADGLVLANDELAMTVYFNAEGMSEGVYLANIHILSNDEENSDVVVAVELIVHSAPDIQVTWDEAAGFPEFIDWNLVYRDVFTNMNYDIPISILNEGTLELTIDGIESGDEAFTVDRDQLVVDPGEVEIVVIRLSSGISAMHQSQLTIFSDDPDQDEYAITLSGQTLDPPVIRVDPINLQVDNSEQEVIIREVTVENIGQAPLHWTTDAEVISEPERDTNLRSLRSVGSRAPVRDDVDIEGLHFAVFQTDGAWGNIYQGIRQLGANPQLNDENFVVYNNAADLSDVDFALYDAIMFATGEQWSWNNGAYAQNIARIEEYVANGGGAYFETGNMAGNMRYPSPGGIINDVQMFSNNGVLVVSPNGNDDNYSLMAEVFNGSQPDYWQNNEAIEGSSFLHSGYSMNMLNSALDEGRIEWYQVQAVHEQDRQTPGVVAYGFGSGVVLTVGHPTGHCWWNFNQQGMWGSMAAEIFYYLSNADGSAWLSWEPTEGVIAADEFNVIEVAINTVGLYAGDYVSDLLIESNDGDNPSVAVRIELTVLGIPDIELDWEIGQENNTINWDDYFDETFTGFDYSIVVTVKNEGSGTLSVEDISSESDDFRCEPASLDIEPFMEAEVTFIMNSNENGEVAGIMVFSSEDPNEGSKEVVLRGMTAGAPAIVIDPEHVHADLFTGGFQEETLDLANDGDSDLNWAADIEIVQEPQRDETTRSLRTVDGASAGPTRDELGDELGRFQWNRVGMFGYKAGIAWDEDNELMMLTSNWPNWLAIVDPSDNYRVVQEWQPNMNPMGAAWLNGIYYVIGWANNSLFKYDGQGQNLGAQNVGNHLPTAIAASPELDVLVILDEWSNRDLYVLNPDGQDVARIERNQYQQFHQGNWSRSMLWVDKHPTGQLWMNTPGHVWQMSFDVDNWTVTGVESEFVPQLAQWGEEWDGLGHTKHDLIFGGYTNDSYIVYDDGISEAYWLSVNPTEGTIGARGNIEFFVTYNAADLLEGDYVARVHLTSNDPVTPELILPVTLNVTGIPEIAVVWEHGVDQNMVNWSDYFIDLFNDVRYEVPVTIVNDGTATLIVEDASSDNNYFICEPASFEIPPRSEMLVTFVLLADQAGEHRGAMSISSNDPNRETVDIDLLGTITVPPEIGVEPGFIHTNNDNAMTEDFIIDISNNGQSLLRWSTDFTEPDRDGNVRGLRTVNGSAGPVRDDPVDLGDMTVAVFETNNGWNNGMFEGFLNCDNRLNRENMVVYRNGADWDNVDFSQYTVICVNAYNQPWAQQYANNLERFEEYIAGGGAAYFETANTQGGVIRSPGGIYNDLGNGYNNGTFVVSPEPNADNYSRLAELAKEAQPEYWSESEFIEGSSFLHSTYGRQQFDDRVADGTLDWYQVIAVGEGSQDAGVVAYGFGGGTVMTVGHPVGFGQVNFQGPGNWHSIIGEVLFYLAEAGGADWISWDPQQGTVEPGSNGELVVSLNSIDVIEGDYEGNLHILSNVPGNEDVVVNIQYHVTGYSDIALAWEIGLEANLIDFNTYFADLWTGGHYEVPVTVKNEGTAALVVGEITTTGDHFSVQPAELNIAVGDEADIMVILETPNDGFFEGQLILRSNDADEAEVIVQLQGQTGAPPMIALDPDHIEQNLVTGQKMEIVVDISNAGGTQLRWAVETDIRQEGDERDGVRRSLRSIDGKSVGPIRDDFGEEIGRFQWNRSGMFSYKAGIAYDMDNDLLMLTSYSSRWIAIVDPEAGYQTVTEWMPNMSPMGATWLNGKFYVIGWANNLLFTYDINGNELENFQMANHVPTAITASLDLDALFILDDANNRDLFVINEQGGDVARIDRDRYQQFQQGNWSRSLLWVDKHKEGQLWMNTSGHIWQMSVDVANWDVTGLVSDFAPQINGWAEEWDGLGHDKHDLIFGCYTNDSYIIYDDGVTEAYWLAISPESGTVDAQSNNEILVFLDAAGLFNGNYIADVHFLSNDPQNGDLILPVIAHVRGAPAISTEPLAEPLPGAADQMEFPATYVGGNSSIDVLLTNVGTELFIVDGAISSSDDFSCNIADGLQLDPNQESAFQLTFNPTAIGELEGRISIFTNSENVGEGEDLGTMWFDMIGLGQTPPVIATEPEAEGTIRVCLPIGNAPTTRDLVIYNDGGEGADDLDWKIVAAEPEGGRDIARRSLRGVSGAAGPVRDRRGEPDQATYEWRDSDEADGPDYEWINIVGIDGAQSWQMGDDDGRQVQMGFEFPFYDRISADLWICSNGWVSFSNPEFGWQYFFQFWPQMPSVDVPVRNTLMSALTDWLQPAGGNTWFWSNEEMAVVTWDNIMHIDRDGQWTFQVVMYANGYAKFQYANCEQRINRGCLIGYQNFERNIGAEFFRGNEGFIRNEFAIGVGPRDVWGPPWLSIEPNEGSTPTDEESLVTLTFDSQGLQPDVEYLADLRIESNDPNTPTTMLHLVLRTGGIGPVNPVEPSSVSHSLLITGITFDDEPVPTGWEVGVFTPAGVMAGNNVWQEDDMGIAVYGADEDYPDYFMPGETMRMLLWDNVADVEWQALANLEDGDLVWQADGSTILSVYANSEKTLQVALRSGWNLISINVTPTDQNRWNGDPGPEIAPMMEQLRRPNGGAHHVIIMKNERGLFFLPDRGFNGIPYWNLAEGYHVRMDTAMAARWTGVRIDPQTDVPITRGWNMIAYFPEYQLLASRASQNYVISPIINNVVIAKDGLGNFMIPSRDFFSNMPPWREGLGYQINVNADVVLNYPMEQNQGANLAAKTEANGHWTEITPTGSNMSVLITKVAGVKLVAGDQVAAFNKAGNMVGVGNVIDGQIGLAVWGDDASTDAVEGLANGETFTLKLWNSATSEIVELGATLLEGDKLEYVQDGFSVISASVLTVPTEYSLGQNYPNPFNVVTRIAFGLPEASRISVRVFDLSGREVSTLVSGELKAGHHSVVMNGEAMVSGVYIVKMEAANFSAVRKVMLVK